MRLSRIIRISRASRSRASLSCGAFLRFLSPIPAENAIPRVRTWFPPSSLCCSASKKYLGPLCSPRELIPSRPGARTGTLRDAGDPVGHQSWLGNGILCQSWGFVERERQTQGLQRCQKSPCHLPGSVLLQLGPGQKFRCVTRPKISQSATVSGISFCRNCRNPE